MFFSVSLDKKKDLRIVYNNDDNKIKSQQVEIEKRFRKKSAKKSTVNHTQVFFIKFLKKKMFGILVEKKVSLSSSS